MKRVICIGDSLTHGYGVAADECYVSLLTNLKINEVINKGKNGDTTSSLLCRSHEDLVLQKPDYAVLMAGTNDFLMGLSARYAFENLCILINEADQNSIIPVVMNPPMTYTDMAHDKWSSFINYKKINDNLFILGNLTQNFCISRGFPFINLFQIFSQREEDFSELYIDGIHLSAEGHKLVYESLLNATNIFSPQ